jgi:hypothetical protein
MSYNLEAARNALRHVIEIKHQNQSFEDAIINVVVSLMNHIEELEHKVKSLETIINNK